jgi:NADH-quinone oxidoreductase subunit E
MACNKLGVGVDEVTADGMFTGKPVMCLAACDKAPMMQVNLKYEENLDEEKFDALITRLRNFPDDEGPIFGVELFKQALRQE